MRAEEAMGQLAKAARKHAAGARHAVATGKTGSAAVIAALQNVEMRLTRLRDVSLFEKTVILSEFAEASDRDYSFATDAEFVAYVAVLSAANNYPTIFTSGAGDHGPLVLRRT